MDQQVAQHLDDHAAHARMAAPETHDLEGEHQPNDLLAEFRTRACAMREDEIALERREIGLADPRSGELAESGIDAVDRPAFGERAIEHIVARFDVVPGRAAKLDSRVAARNPAERGKRDSPRHDRIDAGGCRWAHRPPTPFDRTPQWRPS